jgi:O-antigen/teichoic acid export membrane protein
LTGLKRKAIVGVFWGFLDRAGSQSIGFIITLFLARILLPSDFGLVAMASVVVGITRIFIDSGLNDSLIQKQACSEVDFNTVFYFNVATSLFLFGVIYLSAPVIASFFGYPELVPIIRVIGLKPFIAGLSMVQLAILQKEMLFSSIVKARLPSFVVSGGIGLLMAWYGYGVWSLIVQSLLESFLFLLILWRLASWRPGLTFNFDLFKFHWKHGSRLLIINALGAVYRNIFSIIIGKYFSAAQLGYYSRADSFKTIVVNNTSGLLQTVSYPVLSKFQGDNHQLKKAYRKTIQINFFFLLPILCLLSVGASPIIEWLLTSKWLPVAPILVILMFTAALSPFNSINLNILKVKRRTDLLLKIDLLNKAILLILVAVATTISFEFLILTNLLIAIIAMLINSYFVNRMINYSLREQFEDLWALWLAIVLAGGVACATQRLLADFGLFWHVFFLGLTVVTSYLVLILFLRKEIVFSMFAELKTIVRT